MESVDAPSTRFLASALPDTANSVDMTTIPEPWRSAMDAAGVVDPRRGHPSQSELARRLGVHPSTVTAMIGGDRSTSLETVQRTADILGKDAREVHGWLGRARAEREPYRPPGEANLLDKDQRKAVDGLIKLMARYAPVEAAPSLRDVPAGEAETFDPVERTAGPARQPRRPSGRP